MRYFFPKLGKTIEAENISDAKNQLKPKKQKNVGKTKKSSKEK